MPLFQDQIDASDKFLDWLNNTEETFAGLWASAGYGKSYTVKHLIEVILKETNLKPAVASMTHSAVEVLSNFTGMEVVTMHSLMGWIPYVDKDTGEEGLSTPQQRKPTADHKLTSNMIVIVDEAGLLGKLELELLKAECATTGARVLFVGDHKQCFPVMKDDDELCVPAYNATQCMLELTVPKRTDKDNTIFKLSEAYRRTVDGGRQPKLRTLLNPDNKTGVRYVEDLEEVAYKAFAAGKRDGDIEKIKVLAFTNSRCLTLNRKIRKNVLGIKDSLPRIGEEMVANTAIENSVGDQVIIKNNERVTVKGVEPTVSYGLDGAFISFTKLDGDDVEEAVFVPANPSKLLRRLKELSSQAKQISKQDPQEAKKLWRSFYSLKDSVSDIRFTYAMTINKAQGVTLKHALVDLNDISICQNREQAARLAYTAVTRATTYVTLEGSL